MIGNTQFYFNRLIRTRLAISFVCLSSLLAAPLTRAAPSEPWHTVIQPYIDSQTLAGAVVAVASKDECLALQSFGYADLQTKRVMETNDLFWIASQTKPMTAAALMMLMDEGRLSPSDPVEKFLPEFKDLMVITEKDSEHTVLRKPGHPITVKELLSHTSGMAFSSPLEQPSLDLLPLRHAVKSYAMMPLLFEPGTKYQYSNAGINTAARIIEVLSKMPYEQFLQERLLRPLGMTETTFRPTEVQLKRLATSYKKTAEGSLAPIKITQLKYPLNDPARQPVPAGGLFSTARDLTRFCRMILNGGTLDGKRYLSERAVQQMTSKQTGEAISNGYGFGWMTGDGWCAHDGAYNTCMKIDRKNGLIMIWLVQDASSPSDDVRAARKAFETAAAHAFEK